MSTLLVEIEGRGDLNIGIDSLGIAAGGTRIRAVLAGYAAVMVMMVAVRPLLLLQRGEGLLRAVEIVRVQRVADLL